MLITDPFWWGEADGLPKRSLEAGGLVSSMPADVDCLIIGAGYTGLSAARTLAKAGKTVLVLDASDPCFGASSRNGGMVGGGHRLSIHELQARFGKETGLSMLREAHLESFAFVRDLIETEGLDCDLQFPGRYRGLWTHQDYEAAGRSLDHLQSLIDLPGEMIPKSRQRDFVSSDLYAGGQHFPHHGAVNPAKYAKELMRVAEKYGAVVLGNTPVLSVEKDGAHFRVNTPCGHLRAGHVLQATNGYGGALNPRMARSIIPIPSFIIATEALGENRVKDFIPEGHMIVENRDRHCYYRPSPDGRRIIFGGRAAMIPVGENLATRELQKLIGGIFPDHEPLPISHSWWGKTGFTFDLLPHVGQYDGIWCAMGYSGSGTAMAPYLGHKVALQILGDKDGETAFAKTPFSKRWWHQGSCWFMPFADLLFRLKDIQNNLRSGQ